MRIISVAGLVLLIFSVIGLCATSTYAEEAGPVLKVNGTVLTQFHLNDAMSELLPAASFHGGVTPETTARYRPKAIDIMIERELLYQEAKRLGLRADSKKVDAEIDKVIERLRGKKIFRAALKNEGTTEKEYEENLYRKFTVELYEEQEIKAKSVASPEEIKEAYEHNMDSYKRPESRKLSHILVSVDPSSDEKQIAERKKRAKEALDKIKAGADFGTVAWDYSDDPYRVKGGDLGMVHRGRLDEDIEQTAFSLKNGEVSDLIRSIYGFHIIRIDGIYPPVQLKLDEVTQSIKSKLEEDKRKTLKETILKRLKEKATIEVF